MKAEVSLIVKLVVVVGVARPDIRPQNEGSQEVDSAGRRDPAPRMLWLGPE